jgi:elongation factor 1-beta
MGIVAVKIKIMPSSPEVNLKEIEEETKKLIQQKGGENPKIKEEAVAFGLNAIIVLFAWPEEKPLEPLEASLKSIKNVSSVQVIDMRRAIG